MLEGFCKASLEQDTKTLQQENNYNNEIVRIYHIHKLMSLKKQVSHEVTRHKHDALQTMILCPKGKKVKEIIACKFPYMCAKMSSCLSTDVAETLANNVFPEPYASEMHSR